MMHGQKTFIDTIIDDEYMRVRLETFPDGEVFVHTDIFKWSKDLFELYLLVWGDIIVALKNKGIKRVRALAACDEPKILKFQSMFGFIPVGKAVSQTGREYFLTEFDFNGT